MIIPLTIKKVFFAYAMSLLLVVGVFLTPQSSSAQTVDELKAQIQALLQQLTAIQAQLSVISGQSTGVICPNITYNLYLGLSDSTTSGQITGLQKFLAQYPDIYPEARITGYYGPLTAQAVQRFQRKHNIVSSGSPESTGYGVVGRITRAKMQLCGQVMSPAVSIAPLQVISPNGGEVLQLGKTYAITWEQNSNERVALGLENERLPGTGDSLIYRKSISGEVNGVIGKNVYYWTPSADIPVGGGYRVSMAGYFGGGAERPSQFEDKSDASFTITSNTSSNLPSTITILSPNGGETLKATDNIKIRWSSASSSQIDKILLTEQLQPCGTGRSDCGRTWSLVTGTENDGYYEAALLLVSDGRLSDYVYNYDIEITLRDGTGDRSDSSFSIITL